MANDERKDICCYRESGESTTSSDDNELGYGNLLSAVIEKNETLINKLEERFSVTTKQVKKKTDREKHYVSVKTEVILLNEAPSTSSQISRNIDSLVVPTNNRGNPRVIELSDDKSKMELRREFKVDVANPELSCGDSSHFRIGVNVNDDDGSADILSRLPPGTILIKQTSANPGSPVENATTTRTSARDDSDYVHDSSKESTGTNSSESSSAASSTAGKLRRIQYRSVRSKKIVEVRRNPVRNKKKKPIDEELARPRQRLLAAKRKPNFVIDGCNPTRKRARTVPTPYMNTRSVTRKMYTVGATYQAPTMSDALEWKEWPSHGMHERPIWHPQVGLAYEYNEKSFVSLDGENYREIIEDPVIEVVSVDPHPERVSMYRKNYERMRYCNVATGSLTGLVESVKREPLLEENSFQSCMHGSFHSVLAYCARVVTPNYKKNVDMKIRSFARSEEPSNNPPPSQMRLRPVSNVAENLHQEPNKFRIPPMVAAAAPARVLETHNFPSTSATSGELPKCLVVPRKTIHFTNVRNIQSNILQEVFSRSSKNTLIFLKPTDPPGKTAEKIAAALKNSNRAIPPVKNKDGTKISADQLSLNDGAISDEVLMEMSSIYNNILPNEEQIEPTTKSDLKHANYVTRPVTALVATKISKKSSDTDNQSYPARASGSGYRTEKSGATINHEIINNRLTCSNQAAEIAKILAEYNQKAAKNSGIRQTCYASSNVSGARISAKSMKTMRINGADGRNTYFSLVPAQTKNIRVKREEDLFEPFRGSFSTCKQICHARQEATSTITSGVVGERNQNDGQQSAMDLTTVKQPRDSSQNKQVTVKTEERKWLQDLIEDTAILYCAAAGVHQDDVAEYIKTLDPAQSLQWLGS